MRSPIPIPRTGNPNYPLPADYYELTPEGARQARVNACRQWLIPGNPIETGDRRVASTWFFDRYYLHPDPQGDFDPGFYDDPPLETPSLHWDMSRQWALYRMSVTKAPRGCAKSTHCRKDMLMCMVSAPRYSFAYATSTHDNAKFTGQVLRDQGFNNRRINDDFCPDYDLASLKPVRGSKPTGVEFFFLNNGSWVRSVSAQSRLRGLRPKKFRLDDPEYDEHKTTSMQDIRDYMDRLLFKIALQMVLRAGAGIDWVGTFVSKRHYLWHALSTIKMPDGTVRAEDSRFDHWARLSLNAAYEGPDGSLISVWPDMWPSTIAEKVRLNKLNRVSIEEMPSIMGVAAFNAEMMDRPGSADDEAFFKFDPSSHGPHAYWYEDIDTFFPNSPWRTTTLICYLDPKTKATVRTPLPEFLASCRLFITIDTAYTEKASSDRRCCTQLAQAPGNILFVLDMWSDRRPDSVLEHQAFEMAHRWRSPVIYIEVVKESFKVYARFVSSVQTRMADNLVASSSHIPSIKPLRPGLISKLDKIAGLDTRFEHSLIKIPIDRRMGAGSWSRLIEQIEGFTPESQTLPKDDEIDTVSMSMFVLKGRRALPLSQGSAYEPVDPVALLESGQTHWLGMPIVGGLDINTVPHHLIQAAMSAASSSGESKI